MNRGNLDPLSAPSARSRDTNRQSLRPGTRSISEQNRLRCRTEFTSTSPVPSRAGFDPRGTDHFCLSDRTLPCKAVYRLNLFR